MLFVLCALPIMAQHIVFKASPAQLTVNTHEIFQLEYVIENTTTVDNYQAPNFDGFEMVRPPMQGPYREISIVNGKTVKKSSLVITYTLRALKKGNFTIMGANATINGKSYASNSVKIEVNADGKAGSGVAQNGRSNNNNHDENAASAATLENIKKNIFIKVIINNKNPYVGEEVIADYKLYTRLPMTMNITELPSLKGFWSEDFVLPSVPKPQEEVYNGIPYQVFTLKKTALFPQQSGTLVFESAKAEGTVRVLEKSKTQHPFADHPFFSFLMDDPFFNNDLFADFNYRDVPINLSSSPLNINAKPLPQPAPNNFTGGVGRFSLHNELEEKTYTTDDVITYKLIIKGEGNTKLIQAPTIEWNEDLGATEPYLNDSILSRNPKIISQKTIVYYLNPKQAGQYTIPEVNISYFNPATQQYETITAPSKNINILEGKNKGSEQISYADNTANKPSSVNTRGPWLIGGIMAVVLAGLAFVFLARRKTPAPVQATIDSKDIANKHLATAKSYLNQESTAFYEELNKALWLYISQKLNIPLGDLVKKDVLSTLAEKNISATTVGDISTITQKCEVALYASQKNEAERQALFEKTRTVLSELENKL